MLLKYDLCDGVYVEVWEDNEVVIIYEDFFGWAKYCESKKYHKAKIIKIETDEIETSDDDGMPMYFDTTDSEGTRIRWSTKKSRFGKPVYIWPKGSTFSIWKNGKYVNEKD